MKRRLQRIASRYWPMACAVGLLLLWELICRLWTLPDYVLPAPSTILKAGLAVTPADWIGHTRATVLIALLGFLLSCAISLPLAMMMVLWRPLERLLLPALVVIQATPVVAIAPLLIVILGTGDAPRLVIVCLITFFPLVVSATTGMLACPPEWIELSRSLRGGSLRELWQVRLPAATGHIFAGIKVAITLAIIGAVVAEFVAAEQGLGYFVQFSTSFFKIPQAFAALVVLSFISLLLYRITTGLQRRFFSWSLPDEYRV